MEEIYDLHVLKMRFVGFFNYSYIGIDKSSRYAFAIDPSWELETIIKTLSNSQAVLKAIFLTHSHFDHVNLANQLVELYNSSVYISQVEADYYNFNCANLKPLFDMDEICIGDTKVSCILTPGHTKGGMCYLIGNNIFTGDTIFTEGCGICRAYGGSAEQMFESIQKIKKNIPQDVCVFPGHSYGKVPGKTLKCLKNENIYFQIDIKKHFIEFRMRENQKGLFNFK